MTSTLMTSQSFYGRQVSLKLVYVVYITCRQCAFILTQVIDCVNNELNSDAAFVFLRNKLMSTMTATAIKYIKIN